MIASEFAEWIVQAEGAGAEKLVVRRAQKGGVKQRAALFLDVPIKGVDVPRSLERMRDDVKARSLTHASFEVEAVSVKGDVIMRDRINMSRHEELSGAEQEVEVDPGVTMARMILEEAHRAYDQVLEMARAQSTFLGATSTVVENMGNSLVARDAKIEEMLGRMFEIFSLKNERDADIRKSEDNRAIAKGAFETLGPIAGSIASHVMKNAQPAWAAFAQSLLNDQDRFIQIVSLLKPEEVVALEAAMGATFPKKPATAGGTAR